MAEVKKYDDGVTDIEFSSGRKLAFNETDPRVVDILKNRVDIHTAIALMKEVDKQHRHGAAAWEGNVTVISVGGFRKEKWEKGETFYYRAQFDGHPYFIKKLQESYGKEYGGGHKEIMDTRAAKELVRDLSNVEIVDYVLGYEGSKDWYFVSSWNDAFETTLDVYLHNLAAEIRKNPSKSEALQAEYDEILDRTREITKRLRPEYEDVMTYNMAYDPSTKKIFLFDLNKKKKETMKVD